MLYLNCTRGSGLIDIPSNDDDEDRKINHIYIVDDAAGLHVGTATSYTFPVTDRCEQVRVTCCCMLIIIIIIQTFVRRTLSASELNLRRRTVLTL